VKRLATIVCLAAIIGTASAAGFDRPGLDCNLLGPTYPCSPYLLYPPGQELRLTIRVPRSDNDGAQTTQAQARGEIDSIAQLFAALRSCWITLPDEEARPGMEITVRFALKRDGNMLGPPRLTYGTKGASQKQRDTYYRMIIDSLNRCTTFPLSRGMAGAIAGRPLLIRYIDTRGTRRAGE
jgi:hypothetical protein